MIEREGAPGGEFRALTFVPAEEPQRPAALVYLHGIGERGDDLALVKRYGLPALLAGGAAICNGTVICPQLELQQAEWPPERLFGLIAAVKRCHSPVVLAGYSLGGLGVCELVGLYGGIVDLAVVIAGRCRSDTQVAQVGTTFLAIQGELDPWPAMTRFVHSIQAHGGMAQEVTLPGQGHFISEEALWHPLFQARTGALGLGVAPHPAGVADRFQ